ncbi:unnamed protein product [Rotaria sordida]|uniref:PLAT domain-containing protein n=1 Tax=Rotaria sordida TaxID=392033 RepID=A0A819HFV7_9BILA|nr:unnamed protein product [Rotaria sordida]
MRVNNKGFKYLIVDYDLKISVSYNQPKFCPHVSWDLTAITIANIDTVGSQPYEIFINTNNTIYVPNRQTGRIIVWYEGNITSATNISANLSNPYGLFVAPSYDIYVDSDNNNGRVTKWTLHTTISVPVMHPCQPCWDIFIDINDTLYCSMNNLHQVITKSLNSDSNALIIVGGTSVAGSTSYMLNSPRGIFVDINFDLYVADCNNNRIQLFQAGQLNGITVAGNGAINTITLNCPSGIVLDADNYLFILDQNNYRIVRSGPNGFQCLVGCYGGGSASHQLITPMSMAFDSFGNIFVSDSDNSRIQKTISVGVSSPYALYVTTSGDIYVDNGNWNGRVDKLALDGTIAVPIMYVGQSCYGLFVGINDILYCSIANLHRVVTKPLNSISNTLTIAAGTGCSGSTSDTLNSPRGIFVDINFDLYVADCNNNRIQLFQSGQLNGITVAGNGAINTITLNCPSGIVLDADNYLFIVDQGNHRIVRSGPNGFRCLVGCYGGVSASNQLLNPQSMAFDSFGNIFVYDSSNNRIQKFVLATNSCILPYNQPKLCPHASWNAKAQTFASNSTLTSFPHGIFISGINTVYVVSPSNNYVLAWSNGDVNPIKIMFSNLSRPHSIFVSMIGDIYVDNGYSQGRIDKWAYNSTYSQIVMNMNESCYSLFIDINNTLYCSVKNLHQIITLSLNDDTAKPQIVAGSDSPGSSANMLDSPHGIFVNINFDLYVADCGNDRIQLFQSGQSNGTTVAGHEATNNITLSCPTGIVLDADNYLFIVDSNNHRIIRLGLNGFQCLVGCYGSSAASNQLLNPQSMAFDSYGNMFVTDRNNSRIQKFIFQKNFCEQITTNVIQPTTAESTIEIRTEQTSSTDQQHLATSTDQQHITTSTDQQYIATSTDQQHVTTSADQQHIATSTDQQHIATSTDQQHIATSTDQQHVTTSTDQQHIATSTDQQHLTTSTDQQHITTSNIFLINQTCFAPTITLIPASSCLTFPLQFRRNQDFYISSNIQLNCNNSFSLITKWTIMNCTSICSYQISTDQIIETTFSELYIPARTLPHGIYELKLTVTITTSSNLILSKSAFVKITPSGITANLVQLGTSMITRGNQQDLKFDPGTFSIDLDGYTFNASNWKYKYYCRIYGLSMFPNFQGSHLTIDDPRIDRLNPSCLLNRTDQRTAWKYDGVTLAPESSVTILAGSLSPNRTYQFMVHMENRQNSSLQATGYVLVKVEETRPQMIAIGCVIWTMCVPNLEFQLINPTTQVALFAICLENCTTIQNITWNIYQGSMNSSSNFTKWIQFNQIISYQNIWFFGTNTSNFTATNKLFLDNPNTTLWRFEVVYSFLSETSSSALNFIINQCPYNGSCSINPSNGTTNTLFTISCPDWFDEDNIKDYLLYTWIDDPLKLTMIAFSPISDFQVRLPAEKLNLIVHIRDTLDCVREFNLMSINVELDPKRTGDLINQLQSKTTNPIIQLLSSGNQNIVGQVITSLSQQFNQMNNESVNKAVSNGIPAASVSISPLGIQSFKKISVPLNTSALEEFNKELNIQANLREYLIHFTINLAITTVNSIKLQSASLARLTQATNQLTRTTLMIASEKCYQLSDALHSMSTRISYEDAQIAATQLIQCATNILTAVNGPLQQRTNVLDLDLSRAITFPNDYDTDLEFEWSNPNLFTDENDFSWERIEKGRNIYYQKKLAKQITIQVNKIISLLTSTLNIHLNIGQNLILNTSEVFLSLETISIESLSNKFIQQIGNGQIHFPLNFSLNLNKNATISLRSMMEPLASFGNFSHTNLSTSISLSILDHNGNEISIRTDEEHPIEIIIPRDPNLIIPSMILQNVTSMNSTLHNQLFFYHYVNISSILPISVHFEIQPLDTNLAYLLIYKFDQFHLLNSSINQIDGWTLLCPWSNLYTYFIDNQRTTGHQSLIFGLRELNSTEIVDFCSNHTIVNPPISDKPFNFSSDYQLRIYTSGCYYLDENNQWKSDGLLIGPLTNLYQTQCFSNHLTKFAGGFHIILQSVNWNYVFANADFVKNKTIYLTVISVFVIYSILIIYARYKDKKDLEKLGVTPLPDNHQSDQYYYQIIVFTGQRKDAGTKSKVHFVLSGNDYETQIRTFADSHRKIFQRGGIDAFIMAVPKSLGLLNYIHIWHDNTGQGSSASWFLNYIIIRDLQTMKKFHFICQKWFAVEKDDGKIERILPVASELEKREFSYVLSKQAYHSISDSHLWFSIFSCSPSNKFTRVQRCTCCFVLLFISMFLNIMYYDLSKETNIDISTNAVSLAFGTFFLTLQQVIIDIIIEFISLLTSLLLVQFFRRIRSRQHQISPLNQALIKIKSHVTIKNNINQKLGLTFPWWCIFIAYGLSLILLSISILFIIAHGIEFGNLKARKWLTSILSVFFSSIFLTQPLKVLCLAIFFAFFFRNSNDDNEAKEYIDENQIDLNNDEEYLHSIENNLLFNEQSSIRVNRLTEDEIAYARNQRLKEMKMWSITRETLTYLCFLLFLGVIIYSNRDSNSYLQVKHLRKYFFNSKQMNSDYSKITTINEYWKWLENSFVSNLHAQQWYNGYVPRDLSEFINDKSNRLIGGYVYEFRSNLSKLHQLGWIDSQTRAIFIQLSLYNPNVQLFTSVTFLMEFLSTGEIYPQSRFEPMNFYVFTSLIELIGTIFYMMFIVYFMLKEFRLFFQLKLNYFRQFWSLIELGIMICSWMKVAVYIWRYRELKRISKLFHQTNGYVYINLQLTAYVNDLLTYLLSFCCFFGTIKLIRLCRFNRRLSLFGQTLHYAGKALGPFSLMFSTILMSFLCLFYLLFVSKISSCSSLLNTAQMLFEMTLLKFNAKELTGAAAFLGPFSFSLFIILVVFICMSMFLSIINDNFRLARENQNNDDEMFSFIVRKFLHWIGLKKVNELGIQDEQDIRIRLEYSNAIEILPEKIDRLLEVLDQMHISQIDDRLRQQQLVV